ncbi:MAG TPA: 8-oxo-dGTP diphosphatase [Ktedonosporobacter sp.]|nr:8-oxo-dGTP diphosphatase [Ktedonosporobacter sp.]
MYTPILATLGYILSRDGKQVLMIHRNKRPDDAHFGKYNGLGGRLEANEDVVSGMSREILEESGLVAERVALRGTISWPGFGKNDEAWFGFIFLIESWQGEVNEGNHEGTLEWVPRDALHELPMWPSDHNFLPMVFDGDPRLLHGCMPFYKGEMVSWSYTRI